MDNYQKILFRNLKVEDHGVSTEGAWASKVGENYKLENILFYAREYSLGDIVEVQKDNGELVVKGLVEESGHSTIRIYFQNESDVQPIREQLKQLGCSSEISNQPRLVSFDIPPNVKYSKIKKLLVKGFKSGAWDYEEACIAHKN